MFVNLLGHGYDYRTTVAPWFRGLFSGSPDVTAIANAPVVYQVHAASAWLIWAVWPFSRLVHAWSAPLWYLWRPYIVYRSRVAVPSRRAGHQRPPVAQDRRPLLDRQAKSGNDCHCEHRYWRAGTTRLGGQRRLSGICTRAISRS